MVVQVDGFRDICQARLSTTTALGPAMGDRPAKPGFDQLRNRPPQFDMKRKLLDVVTAPCSSTRQSLMLAI